MNKCIAMPRQGKYSTILWKNNNRYRNKNKLELTKKEKAYLKRLKENLKKEEIEKSREPKRRRKVNGEWVLLNNNSDRSAT